MDQLIAILTPPAVPTDDSDTAEAPPHTLIWAEYERRKEVYRLHIRKLILLLQTNHGEVMIETINSAPKKWTAAPYGYPYRFLTYCWQRVPHTAYIYLTQLRTLCVLMSLLDASLIYRIDYVD